MLEIPQGTAAMYNGNHGVVVLRRRRTGGPLERPRVPRIIPGRLSSQIRPNQIARKEEDSGRLKHDTDGNYQIPDIPTASRLVGIDPPGHPQQSRDMHEIESKVETDKEKPEVQLSKRFA